MTSTAMWMVVVSYSEWLNWMAWGELRLHARIGRLEGPADLAGFAELMNRAPDLRVEDEQAFVLAQLRPGFRASLSEVPGSRTAETALLALEAVESFFPVTERAGRLLAADAHRARARLGAPVFEAAWTDWATARRTADADRRGRGLAKVLGLPTPDPAAIPGSVRRYLTGQQPPPNAVPLGDLEGRCAYSWAATFGLLEPLVGLEAKQALGKELELADVIRARRQVFTLLEPILRDTEARRVVDALQRILRDRHGVDVCLLPFVVFWHYEQLLRKGKDISLPSLVDDLATLAAEHSASVAASTAWLIGRLMHDAAVTTLLYAAEPSRWAAVDAAPINVSVLDVGRRASHLPPPVRAVESMAPERPPEAAISDVGAPTDAEAVPSDAADVATPPPSVDETPPEMTLQDSAPTALDGEPAIGSGTTDEDAQPPGADNLSPAPDTDQRPAEAATEISAAVETAASALAGTEVAATTNTGTETADRVVVDQPPSKSATGAVAAGAGGKRPRATAGRGKTDMVASTEADTKEEKSAAPERPPEAAISDVGAPTDAEAVPSDAADVTTPPPSGDETPPEMTLQDSAPTVRDGEPAIGSRTTDEDAQPPVADESAPASSANQRPAEAAAAVHAVAGTDTAVADRTAMADTGAATADSGVGDQPPAMPDAGADALEAGGRGKVSSTTRRGKADKPAGNGPDTRKEKRNPPHAPTNRRKKDDSQPAQAALSSTDAAPAPPAPPESPADRAASSPADKKADAPVTNETRTEQQDSPPLPPRKARGNGEQPGLFSDAPP